MRAVMTVVLPMVKEDMPIAIVQVRTKRDSWRVEVKHAGRLFGSSDVDEVGDEGGMGDW